MRKLKKGDRVNSLSLYGRMPISGNIYRTINSPWCEIVDSGGWIHLCEVSDTKLIDNWDKITV